ncbi:DUF2336 domain-containing protein [Kordiimonas aestuarii]|uniref:DUF2336 domain-containing protein n=1 Tax=Kordiimonas aestuarii TaxID=1005925 RepID=UPI0021D3412E|nr:DUF2336 domain-containing protein [Kordiimonas aestuarii]
MEHLSKTPSFANHAKVNDAGESATETTADHLWGKLRAASPGRIHAQVIELKVCGGLTGPLVYAMTEKGSKAFLESSLAILAGLPLLDIRDILEKTAKNNLRVLLRTAGMKDELIRPMLPLICRLYGKTAPSQRPDRVLYLA